MNRQQLAQFLTAGAQGPNQFVERDTQNQLHDKDAALRKYLQQQEPVIAGQKQAAQNAENLKTIQSPELQGLVNDGGSVKAGDLSVGGSPRALMTAGPQEAGRFLKTAQGAYKGINDQLDGAKGTIDALNQGNAVSDKIALMNEVKLALGGSGGKAFGAVMAQLSGDPTMAQDGQKALNWLQNTPNVSTMQPAQRDALREDVYRRIPLIQKQHEQASQQLMQQGPAVAPHADYNTIVQSFTSPTMQKLQDLQGLQKQYAAQRQQMQPQPPVSDPATANPNPTLLDKLGALWRGRQSAQPQQTPAAGMIRVKHKASGQTGTLPAAEYDPNQYEQVQ